MKEALHMKNHLVLAIIAPAMLMAAGLGGLTSIDAESAVAGGIMASKTGDINMDGTANSLDALAVLFHDAGLTATPLDVDTWIATADVDCDLVVTALDAALILQADAGLYNLRP
jgi:hypothetical protein